MSAMNHPNQLESSPLDTVLETKLKDKKIKVVGPLSQVFCELLRTAYPSEITEAKLSHVGLESASPHDVMAQVALHLVNTEGEEAQITILPIDRLTEERVRRAVEDSRVYNANHVLIVDNTPTRDMSLYRRAKARETVEDLARQVADYSSRTFEGNLSEK